jgi:hypothetical protein
MTLATVDDAIREWAYVVGMQRLDSQWLCSDYDTWVRNPHYHGPDQPHPEDYQYDDEVGDGMTDAEADADTLASAGWGTDEDYGYFGGDEN